MSKTNSNNIVPVVYASDNKYAPYMYISIKSLISHTDSNTFYQIYVLYTDLSAKNRKRLQQLAQENISIACINVQKYMKDRSLKGIGTFSVAMYYRLFISEMFKQYPKIVYIDSDTLLLDDIKNFHQISLKGKTIGAIHEVVCTPLVNYYKKTIDMDLSNVFNSGILLIDTQKFTEHDIKEKCIRLLEDDSRRKRRKYLYPDQDVLNLILQGDVFFIESNWNFQWHYLWRLDIIPEQYRQEYLKTAESAKIVHYAGKKPWEYPELEMADFFWEKARDTVYYEEILFTNLQHIHNKNSHYWEKFKKIKSLMKKILGIGY